MLETRPRTRKFTWDACQSSFNMQAPEGYSEGSGVTQKQGRHLDELGPVGRGVLALHMEGAHDS